MRNIKKIYISILSIIFTLMIFGTASFAWISLATLTNIEGLTLTASSGNELELSIDGINFSNQLNTAEIENLFEDIKLYDVTSSDGINFYTGGLRPNEEAIRGYHYLSFDLWLRTSEREHGIYLVNDVSDQMTFDGVMEGTYFVSRGVEWTNRIGFFNGPTLDDFVQPNTRARYYGKDALRISIVELQDDLNTLEQRSLDDLRSFIYDPSKNPLRGYGVPVGSYSYFTNQSGFMLTIPNIFPKTSYRLSAIDPFNPYQALDNESLVAMMQPTEVIDSKGRVVHKAKIRINIWIEGWDADAFDAIHKDLVKIQLQFKALNLAIESQD